jgi:hypothetical protein
VSNSNYGDCHHVTGPHLPPNSHGLIIRPSEARLPVKAYHQNVTIITLGQEEETIARHNETMAGLKADVLRHVILWKCRLAL